MPDRKLLVLALGCQETIHRRRYGAYSRQICVVYRFSGAERPATNGLVRDRSPWSRLPGLSAVLPPCVPLLRNRPSRFAAISLPSLFRRFEPALPLSKQIWSAALRVF